MGHGSWAKLLGGCCRSGFSRELLVAGGATGSCTCCGKSSLLKPLLQGPAQGTGGCRRILLFANVTTAGAQCARRRSPRAAESRHVDDLLLSPLFLSRVQFAFVISFHILFPAFTIGLAHWLAFLEWRWLRTRESLWRDLYFFWLKIFAVSFGMGVVPGIVMSFQFGTNWAVLSERAGAILGPLLSYEVLTAFFLEATFLGVMLFGWKRVSHKVHFFSTCMVALGTLLSTFWIISANSWMQTPQGYAIVDGMFVPVDWWAVIFNPSFPYRLAHMVLAAFITTCFVIGGVSAWYLVPIGRAHV